MEVKCAAAYANALCNALGIRFTELPITAEKILGAIAVNEEREIRESDESREREGMAVMQAAE